MRLKTLLLVVVLSLSFTAGASAATTITVTSTADSTTGTCPSATACNLRAAVAEADTLANHADPPASVEIQLGAGTYPVTQGTLDVSAGLALSIVGNSPATTTIDASGNGAHDLIDENGYSASDSLALSYLSVTGVNATADEALQVQGGSFTATYVTFTENASTVINNQSVGSVTLTGDTFSGDGGRYTVYAGSEATLSDDTFSNDSDVNLVQLRGGGSLSDLTFENATGRVLVLQGDQPYVVNGVVVTGGSNQYGYASIYLQDGGASSSSLTGLDVEGTTSDAGAVAFVGAWSTIDDVTVADNTVSAPDAGVALDLTGSATAENWTVADNTESAGTASPLAGGIALTGGELALRFATVDGNSADGDGDDLYATGSGTALSVGDSILNGTAAGGAQECVADSGATIASLGDNVDHAGTCLQASTDRDGVNPVLGSLSAHTGSFGGSFTPNIEPLGYGSPAVDAVPLSSCQASDEDGDPRPAGTLCDAGAYESPLTKFGIAVTGAPATAVAGTAVTYTVTAENASATTPQSAVITDTLPAGATLSSATVSVGGAAAVGCSGTTTVSCPVGALRRGEQAVATITAVLESAGTDTDTASVTSELPDADDADDTATAGTVVSAAAGSGASGSGGGGTGSGGSGSGGSSTSTTLTPTTTTSTTTTPAGTSSTGVTALSLAPARFTAKSGSTLKLTDGTAGRLTLTITRTARGVRAGKRCVAVPAHAGRHAVACTRTVTVGSLSVSVKVAANHLHFTPVVHGRALAPGRYTLHAGKRATSFTILAGTRQRR
jgi:uncharacterized repeat protein (TIGR01451 family)